MLFNKSQLQAISHFYGPMLVIAGPGSGKTRVITERTHTLIEKHKISPSNILVITFTRSAAREMEERFNKTRNGKNYPVSFGTFHSVFFKIIRHAYGFSPKQIISERKKKEIVEELVSDNLDIDEIIKELSLIKNRLFHMGDYKPKSCSKEEFIYIYNSYNQKMRELGKVDFDDIICMCFRLLNERPDICKMWREKFRFILVDEFQDINRLQFETVLLLAGKERNLFMVGDDDQAIYSFRGGSSKIMKEIEEIMPNLKKVMLEENYRCPEKIVEISLNLINKNTDRYQKKIKSQKKIKGDVVVKAQENVFQENKYIIDHIIQCLREGYEEKDIAILYRINSSWEGLVEQMEQNNISYVTKEHTNSIYEHWMVRDFLAYLNFSSVERKRSDLLRVINRPNRYISREIMYQENVEFEVLRSACSDKPWILKRINKLEHDIVFLKTLTPYAGLTYIWKGMGYEEFIKQKKKMNYEELENIFELFRERSLSFKKTEEFLKYVEDHLQKMKKNQEKIQGDGVVISTIHGVKGLEFPVVFIPDLNEEVFPYKRAISHEEIQEERRLLYVGLTRAKSKLYLSYVNERRGKETYISPFLLEIEKEE